MNQSIKKWTLGSAIAFSIGCVALAGALVTKPVAASAAETESPYFYYVNVGESAFTAKDTKLNLGAGSLQEGALADQQKDGNGWGYTVQGTVSSNAEEGVFAHYSTGAAYSFTMSEAGKYQLALLVEGTGTLAITPQSSELEPQDGEEETPVTQRRVLSQTVTLSEAGDITVTTEGYRLYALMVAPENADVVLDATWSDGEEGKVIVYGELLEKETSVKGYTSGGKDYAPVDYSNLPGGGGANVNFNGFTASGVIRGTDIAINRYFAVMPKSLEYFVNCGSATGVGSNQWQYDGEDENDQFYGYNELVWNFYKEQGNTLKNDGMADQPYASGKTWGYTTSSMRGVRRTAAYAFPFNTIRWTSQGVSVKYDKPGVAGLNVGYKLGNLTPNKEYVVYLGTKSFWHDRTCELTINDYSGKITITAGRDVQAYRATTDNSGVLDILLKGPARQDEAMLAFVAVQDPEKYVPAEAPATNLTSDEAIVDVSATTVTVKGVQEGAKLQIYNEARPYNVLYEEFVDVNKIGEDGAYTLDYKKPFTGVNKFTIVQVTSGGVSLGPSVSVTDIKDFAITGVDGYTSQNITLHITAKAASGIVKCTVQKDYEKIQTFDLYRIGEMNLDYVARDNGTYKVVVYSGIDGVTYSESIVIDKIDKKAPVLTLSPTGDGWDGSGYTVKASVNSIAPVASYTVYKDGVEFKKGEKLPSKFSFTEQGEYEISVVTEANARATSSVFIGDAPVYTKVTKELSGKELTFSFKAVDGYEMQSLTVYQVGDGLATRLTVIGGNELTVFEPATYVAVVKTNAGTTEMYRFEVSKKDLQDGAKPSFTGAIVAGAIAGAAAIGLLVTVLVFKKKKS